MTGGAGPLDDDGAQQSGALHLDGEVGRGGFSARLDIHVAAGEVVALMGPNGAGKSTVVRTVAGLERLRGGRLTLGARLLDGGPVGRRPVGGAGRRGGVPVADRRVGTVFQDHRLFPHLTALGNVAFGPRAAGLTRARGEQEARAWLDRLGVGSLAARLPHQLSGGQAQRVAIARALAPAPAVLVLDEPLAALDAQARGDVQRALAEHLHAFTGPCVLVSHDLVDALVLADRVVVLEEGRVVQDATPQELVRRPATAYVASLLGLTLVRGDALGHARDEDVAVRPSAIRLTVVPPGTRGGWTGTVAAVLPWGEHVRVEVHGDPSAVAEVATTDLGPDLRPGATVRLSVDPADVEVYRSVRH